MTYRDPATLSDDEVRAIAWRMWRYVNHGGHPPATDGERYEVARRGLEAGSARNPCPVPVGQVVNPELASRLKQRDLKP